MPNILVCDDERSICEMLDIALRREGYKIETVTSGEAAKRKIDGALYDVIITDIKMPKIDGIAVLRHVHQVSPESAVVLITAVDDYEAAVQAVKAGGASDYIRKGPGLVDEPAMKHAAAIGAELVPQGARRACPAALPGRRAGRRKSPAGLRAAPCTAGTPIRRRPSRAARGSVAARPR